MCFFFKIVLIYYRVLRASQSCKERNTYRFIKLTFIQQKKNYIGLMMNKIKKYNDITLKLNITNSEVKRTVTW